MDGLADAMQRLAAFKLSKISDKVGLHALPPPNANAANIVCKTSLSVLVLMRELSLQEQAYCRLLSHWVVPIALQGPSNTPFKGLMTPVSMVPSPC